VITDAEYAGLKENENGQKIAKKEDQVYKNFLSFY
jgi:hypothetical protein